ncbi:hypothetical protein Tco_1289555 [Tanacetum coccineum]
MCGGRRQMHGGRRQMRGGRRQMCGGKVIDDSSGDSSGEKSVTGLLEIGRSNFLATSVGNLIKLRRVAENWLGEVGIDYRFKNHKDNNASNLDSKDDEVYTLMRVTLEITTVLLATL